MNTIQGRRLSINRMMTTLIFTALSTLSAAALAGEPSVISIEGTRSAGRGCSDRDTHFSETIDDQGNTVISITFDRLNATPVFPSLAAATNCLIRAKITIPPNKKLRFFATTVRGEFHTSTYATAGVTLRISPLRWSATPIEAKFEANAIDRTFAETGFLSELDIPVSATEQVGLFDFHVANSILATERADSSPLNVQVSSVQLSYRLE